MNRIYFDNISTTPIDSKVLDEMLPYLRSEYGNPSSLHTAGMSARKAVSTARGRIAELVNCNEEEIIFTSGATESNNLAIKGVVRALLRSGKKRIITSPIEHYSVLHCIKSLKKEGFTVTTLDVDKSGMVDPQQVRESITADTALVTITHASNEIGSLEPIEAIGEITRSHNVIFHTDAAQTAGVIPTLTDSLNVDLMTISAHQFYGPKGTGALYIREGVKFHPIIEGGIQEFGYRAGTENVPGIVGMGKAALLARENLQQRISHISELRERIREYIERNIPHTVFTGHPTKRLPGMLSLCFRYIEGESALLYLNADGIELSSGSACASASKTSHVLSAIGIDPATAQGSLIISIGKDNTGEEVDIFLKSIKNIIEKLREMSPLYKKS